MKNTYIAIIVLVLVVLGFLLFINRGNKTEIPTGNVGMVNNAGKMNGATIPANYNASVPATISAPVKEFMVTGQNFSFNPSTISVKKGDVVKITFKNAGGFHDFRIDEFKVATHQIKTDEEETISFIADKTGSFQYYCSVGTHRAMGMWGTLTVE
jgi:nitrosocyanin